MDIKVYKKETVKQPSGETEDIYVPNIIDIVPQFEGDELVNCETVEGKAELEQQCALATIFQQGLDPLDKADGIRWSQAFLEEITPIQLMQDITEAVAKVSSSVQVSFSMAEGEDGNQYLAYTLSEVI